MAGDSGMDESGMEIKGVLIQDWDIEWKMEHHSTMVQNSVILRPQILYFPTSLGMSE